LSEDSSSQEIKDYFVSLQNSPNNPISADTVAVVFSTLGDDTKTTTYDGRTFNIVASPVEYYFTDMVFIKAKYILRR